MVSDSPTPPNQTSKSRLEQSEPGLFDAAREAREQLGLYLAAKAAGIKAAVRNAVLYGMVVVAAAVVALSVLVTCAALLCIGLANALGELLGGRFWAGDLIVGGGVLSLLLLGIFVLAIRLSKTARKHTIANFEKRKHV